MSNNYAADAAAIYDPQQAAEKATLDNSNTQTMAGYDKSQSQIDSTKQGYDKQLDPYAQALNKLLAQKNSDVDTTNFKASQAGLFGSGLAGNETRMLGEAYASNVNQTEAERAAKLSDINTARKNATDTYNTNVGALNTKYQGLKSSYITTQQQAADEKAQYQASIAKALGGYGSGSPKGPGSPSSPKASVAPFYNSKSTEDFVKLIQSNHNGASWGAIAAALEKQYGGKIATGSNLDKALHQFFTTQQQAKNVGAAAGYRL